MRLILSPGEIYFQLASDLLMSDLLDCIYDTYKMDMAH